MIIIPTYNSGKFLAQTIESAIEQDHNVPVVIIDNRSEDDTINIAEKYKDVEVIVNSLNIGRIGNWNKCIETAIERRAPFFKILFAGDKLKSNAMAQYNDIFEKYPETAMITSAYEIVDDNGLSFVNRMLPTSGMVSVLGGLKNNITIGNWYASPSVQAYRTLKINNIRFEDTFLWASDWRFCVDINKRNCVYFSAEVLAEFNTSSRRYYSEAGGKLVSIAEELFLQTEILEFLNEKINKTEYKELDNAIRDKYAARFFTLRNFHRILYRKMRKGCK